jgi:hypothetical protein
MRLKQLALATRNLGPTLTLLSDLLNLGRPFRDPQVGVFGLENAVLAIGDSFLELVSPIAEDASARRFLDNQAADEAGYMVIFESEDVEADRKRIEDLSIRIVWEAKIEGAQTIHLHPKDVGGAIVSFDHMTEPGTWLWAGHDWPNETSTKVASLISGAEISSPDPSASCNLWQAMIGPGCAATDSGQSLILDNGGQLYFAQSKTTNAVGLSGIELELSDPELFTDNAHRLGLATDDRGGVRACGLWLRPRNRDA